MTLPEKFNTNSA